MLAPKGGPGASLPIKKSLTAIWAANGATEWVTPERSPSVVRSITKHFIVIH